jgi:magnesium transporter
MTMRVFDTRRARAFREANASSVARGDADVAVWLDMTGPTQAEIEAIGRKFDFHSLALEDARKRQQRPKVDEYADHLFVVIYAVDPPGADGRLRLSEIAMFITEREVITMHRDDIPEIDTAAKRWAEHCSGSAHQDAYMLTYTIADTIVDGYFPAIDAVGDRIDLLEEDMFSNASADTLQAVFQMKRQLLELRRVVAPTRDVFNSFTRRELPILGDHSLAYFQDVYDHVIRVTDAIDAYREILSSVIDVHLTLVSNRLNETVRTLTAASIVLMSLALIAGIYGMNFEHMPELTWRYGYFLILGVMVAIGAGLALVFKRIGWW